MSPSGKGRDRPEIVVTPEMIEAGVSNLALYVQGEDSGLDAVIEIYRAMEQARCGAPG